MAVLVEAISVVIRADALLSSAPQVWERLRNDPLNETMCADDELVRVGFMVPGDVEQFVERLKEHGLKYVDDGVARDLVVVDQMRGPLVPCEWIEFGHVDLDGDQAQRVAACRRKGSEQQRLVCPGGWSFDQSLSATYGFVPSEHLEKSMSLLRREDGLDIYRNELTGKEMYVGRSHPKDSKS